MIGLRHTYVLGPAFGLECVRGNCEWKNACLVWRSGCLQPWWLSIFATLELLAMKKLSQTKICSDRMQGTKQRRKCSLSSKTSSLPTKICSQSRCLYMVFVCASLTLKLSGFDPARVGGSIVVASCSARLNFCRLHRWLTGKKGEHVFLCHASCLRASCNEDIFCQIHHASWSHYIQLYNINPYHVVHWFINFC